MQVYDPRPTDLTFVNDGLSIQKGYGRKMPKGTPWFTRAGSWNIWTSGTMVPMYDLADDVREFADRRRRGTRALFYVLFLIVLLAGATWAMWSGK